MLTDTHAHLNFSDYDADRDEVMRRCDESGTWAINVGVEYSTSRKAVELANAERGFFAAVGLHPNYVIPEGLHQQENFKEHDYEDFDLPRYTVLAKLPQVVAIGETGLDYHRLPESGEEREKIIALQKEILEKQIELALDLDKPLIIHCRKANDDTLNVLGRYFLKNKSKLRGIAHSFSGNFKQARRYRELGFKIAFNGIITFARDYDKMILDTPLADILVETDCPFLTPTPYRGKRNEPSYVIEVAKKLAEIKNISLEEVARQTTENAKEVFGI